MQKKILTWPMFLYVLNLVMLSLILLHMLVMAIISMVTIIPTVDGKFLMYFTSYFIIPIILPIIYIFDRYIMKDKQKKYTLILYFFIVIGVRHFTDKVIFESPLAINLTYYMIFIFLYIIIFITISLKFRLPKSLKWYLD